MGCEGTWMVCSVRRREARWPSRNLEQEQKGQRSTAVRESGGEGCQGRSDRRREGGRETGTRLRGLDMIAMREFGMVATDGDMDGGVEGERGGVEGVSEREERGGVEGVSEREGGWGVDMKASSALSKMRCSAAFSRDAASTTKSAMPESSPIRHHDRACPERGSRHSAQHRRHAQPTTHGKDERKARIISS